MPAEPAVPRPAATVLLLRDTPRAPTPLQVFLQRRVPGMAFAGGMTVFPGGGVAAADHTLPSWAGPAPAWWAQRLGCPPDLAAALVVAAVRETFEECGVLFADRMSIASPGHVGRSIRTRRTTWPDEMHDMREALVARRGTLADVLDGAGLVLRSDLLAPWARYVTPEMSPHRYDTVFLAARVPDGQVADGRTTEAVEAAWWHPADALGAWRRGDLELMPPTARTLAELVDHADAASALAAAAGRTLRPVMPRVRREGGRLVIVSFDEPAAEPPARSGEPR